MTAIVSNAEAKLGSRIKLTRLVYAVLLLIATSASFYFLVADYSGHLMTASQFALARKVEEYLPPAESLFFFVQLAIVLLFFHPPSLMSDFRATHPAYRSLLRNVGAGLVAGLAAALATLPALIGTRESSGIVTFLVDHFSTGTAIGLAVLLVFLLPVAQAIFFSGILMRELLESISVVSAIMVSTLVLIFSWPAFNSWPTFNLTAGAALGLATGILFWRTKSVLACAVANASFTMGAIILQLWRLP